MPSGEVTYLPGPTTLQQAALVKTWTGVKTDARMLALIDTSGSMKEREGDKTRMVLAGEAAQTAVSIFPNSSQVGLWTFGIDRGGPGQDWREVVPIRQLDEAVYGKPQRQVLGEALPALVSSAGGGTGLYDSLLAAYQRMVSTYAPGRVNSVILLTDGRNEDQAGLTLEQLLARISAVRDPTKPVVIVTVGMGQGVDTAALSAVSAVTGGKTYVAQNPQDIKQVFIDALLSRDCSGSVCTSR
jgi:Mg-chelatase subunit ChlD